MSKSCCSDTGCSCIIRAGEGIAVTGSGTLRDPFIVQSTVPALTDTLQVRDTVSVNLRAVGTGRMDDPLILSADATVRVEALSNVEDADGPDVGDVLTYVADVGGGHWEFSPPPPSPAGAVNATAGLSGLGSAPDPLVLAVSGVWGEGDLLGEDSTVGLPVYVDLEGKVRAKVPEQSAAAWSSITGKPASYPPSSHQHTWDQIAEKPTVFPVSQGGTGGSTKATGRTGLGVHVQQAQPANASINDVWLW